MISLANVTEVSQTLPPRVLVHGQEGVGKTTLGARFPNAVFLQFEDGTPAGLTLNSFGPLSSYADGLAALAALGNEQHDFRTLVVDSLDALEKQLWSHACAENHWSTIEAPGYGKGYVVADRYWHDFLAGTNWLRGKCGMNIVLLAHSAIETVNDPRAPSYTSYQLRLHRRARGIVADEVDLILFLAADVHVTSEDAGFGKKRGRADGGATRYLHTEARPAFLAKSRFDLPARIPCPRDIDVGKSLAPIFPKLRRELASAQPRKQEQHHE